MTPKTAWMAVLAAEHEARERFRYDVVANCGHPRWPFPLHRGRPDTDGAP